MESKNNNLPVPFEAKKKNRFKVEFPKSTGIDGMFVNYIDKPKYNAEYHLRWEDMRIKFFDPIGPSISQQIHEVIRQEDKREDIFEDPLFKITLKTLDPTGIVIEKWEIDVATIVSVDFGKYDSRDSRPSVVTLKVRPANCVLVY